MGLDGMGGKVKEGAAVGIRLLTRTFRLLQVVQPLELPGIPTMLGRRAWACTSDSGYEE